MPYETEITYDTHMKRYRLVAANSVELGHYNNRRQAEEAQLALEAPQALKLARHAAERYPRTRRTCPAGGPARGRWQGAPGYHKPSSGESDLS